MSKKLNVAIIGLGFGAEFIPIYKRHPGANMYAICQRRQSKLDQVGDAFGIDKRYTSYEELLKDPNVDAVHINTPIQSHASQSIAALKAGKHVACTVPMATTVEECRQIVELVKQTGLTYMMGETSYYNPATVYARGRVAEGAFGRIFYAEGDYVHDMDLGFYAAYQYSGGDQWQRTASYPPMLYPTHSVGGVLGAIGGHAVSVSCIGVPDDRGDGVFDREVSMFDNDFSNATALFELAGGGSMRINEFRRVGYPAHIRESRFRYFGTEGSFEQTAIAALWQDRDGITDVTEEVDTKPSMDLDDPSLADVDPALRDAFVSGLAPVHDAGRLPAEFQGLPNGHEGSHHFLVDDFVTAVATRTLPPVNAWEAARYTLPGIIAHESALRGGERLAVPDFGDAPKGASA